MYYLYIIYSAQLDHYYIGVCQDIPDRLRKHSANHRGFTGRANDCYNTIFNPSVAYGCSTRPRLASISDPRCVNISRL